MEQICAHMHYVKLSPDIYEFMHHHLYKFMLLDINSSSCVQFIDIPIETI